MELEEFIEIFWLLVTLTQESSIWLQPTIILFYECFVFSRREESIFILLIECLEENHLRIIYTLIISYRLGIKLCFLCLVFLLLRSSQATHLLNIDIYWMQCEDRNGIVWIGVEVIMTQSGIIDRQCLNHLLTRHSSPICHFLQVLEFTDTKSLLSTQ